MKNRTQKFLDRISLPVPGMVAAGALLVAPACAPPQATSADSNTPEVEQAAQVDPRLSTALQHGRNYLATFRGEAGLDADTGFRARNAFVDRFGQAHIRYDQTYRGVRVWTGDAVVHLEGDGGLRSITNSVRPNINISTTPTLGESDVRSIATRDLRPRGRFAHDPTAELVVYPQVEERVKENTLRGPGGELNAEDIERVVTGYALAYHVHAELENGAVETSHTDYLIDAHSGVVLKKWDTLHTVAATGTGNTQYSGVKSIDTNSITGGWELRDIRRAMNYATYNLNHATSGTGTIYTDTDNTWGDGANYVEGSSTTAANGQTAGVDAHYGVGATFDYYFNVLGRNGIDGAGRATYSRVHYSNNYDNAFWSDSCFCMTYGDGSAFTTLTAIDVAGHEMTHGVTAQTAGLVYSGESGGLNESMSDINGTMVEFYSRGGSGSTIGNTGGNWNIGEQLRASPLRYMDRPSKDGSSRDAWSSTLGSIDVHYSSGPMNRAFFFLSQGAGTTAGADNYSTYLPGGMTGIGNDRAARIAFRALDVYMTSSTNYAAARTACLNAATDLYGATSAEYAAVQNAFAAINVGTPAGGGGGGGGGGSNALTNGTLEAALTPWVESGTGALYTANGNYPHGGTGYAYLANANSVTGTLYQQFAIPATATTLSFWLNVSSAETTTTTQYDRMTVTLRNSAGTVLTTLATYSNLNRATAGVYTQRSFNIAAYAGQTVRLQFDATADSSLITTFRIDDAVVQ